jgi:hypothetical protein
MTFADAPMPCAEPLPPPATGAYGPIDQQYFAPSPSHGNTDTTDLLSDP